MLRELDLDADERFAKFNQLVKFVKESAMHTNSFLVRFWPTRNLIRNQNNKLLLRVPRFSLCKRCPQPLRQSQPLFAQTALLIISCGNASALKVNLCSNVGYLWRNRNCVSTVSDLSIRETFADVRKIVKIVSSHITPYCALMK